MPSSFCGALSRKRFSKIDHHFFELDAQPVEEPMRGVGDEA
jgi:hypothetical protein